MAPPSNNSKPRASLSGHQRPLLSAAPQPLARRPTRVSVIREARHVRRRGLYMGTDIADGQACYLAPTWLRTGCHVLGPTGTGKSRLLLWLFELLCHTGRPLILIDPKGGLFRMARNWALANGHTKRLALFDLSAETLPGYNPLRPNGLSIATQAKWAREGVKSAWGASSFDQTPQLARFLYLCLYVARAAHLSLVEAIDILRPYSVLRETVLPHIHDAFVSSALQAFDRLNARRQEEVTASTVARLEGFVSEPLIRTVITSPQSLDIEEVLTERRILLVNLAKYQPLLPDDVRLLGRLIVNDILAHVYKGHGEGLFDEDHPVYFICDEVQNLATRQLCDALDEGRGIGFHSVIAHQHLAQLADEDQSGYLLRSVMNDARTKLIFGDLDYDDLERVARNVMLDRYTPWALKEQLTTPVFVPVETTRSSRAVSRSQSRGRGLSLPASTTEGTSTSTSRGKSQSVSLGAQRSRSAAETHGTSRGQSFAVGSSVTDVESWAESDAEGEQWGESDGDAASWAASSGMSLGESVGMGQGSVTTPDGEEITTTAHETIGASSVFMSSTARGGSSVHTSSSGGSRMHAATRGGASGVTNSTSAGVSATASESHATSTTVGGSLAVQHGTSATDTTGTSRAVSRGRTPSWSEEEGTSLSETIAPFHAYHREDRVSSRTYLTPEEQHTLHIQALKAIPRAHFVLKTPESSACFVRAPWVDEPWISARKLTERLALVYEQPYYVRLGVPQESETLREFSQPEDDDAHSDGWE